MQKNPLVSCIMPTYNRREFIPLAIRYFKRQSYTNKELIILDDGSDSIADLVPDDNNIRYYRFEDKITLGEKLNLACEYARGPIIVNWDDDDWYASRRITYQVEELLKHKTAICGINHLLYLDIDNFKGHKYIYPENHKTWLLGSSLCYTKEFWKTHRFAHINVGMDGLFVWSTTPDRITVLPDHTFSVHMIHQENISPKQTQHSWWQSYQVNSIRSIMGEDWKYYQKNNHSTPEIKVSVNSHPKITKPKTVQELRNIFACLVHEKTECVIDLVRNLHYHNPSSTIILYNGGKDLNLLNNSLNYSRFNAVVHPSPTPQKHGYLHGFALDCFKFALKNFSFDTLTIVDSDQLCIKPGYSGFLSEAINTSGRIGLLSNNTQQITNENKTNYVAMQAHKEWELWKSFVESFPKGKDAFVHWTFWPGTVFFKEAIKDILKLTEKNKMLRKIMKETKIWATEEVIFSTLVKLMGYEINANPCNFDYIKYKFNFGLNDFKQALNNHNAYWMHPVERSYENPIRNFSRNHYHQYVKNGLAENIVEPDITSNFSFLKIIQNMDKIEGWLTHNEADLLISTSLMACLKLKKITVEIGSFHGKSTVVLGSIVKSFFPEGKVYSIDPHEGVLGAIDQGMEYVTPSYESFLNNINKADLSEVIIPIREYSFNVKWDKPISLLFIDGLHDYPNVSRDFYHFSKCVVSGGYVAFHDYADYYPGVKSFVDELLGNKQYIKNQLVDSLIVLIKK